MNFINKIFGRSKTDPFDKAPYLLPWYFDKHKPKLTYGESTLTWKYVETFGEEYLGIITLNDDKNVLGVFDAYVYIQPSLTGDSFCIWRRSNLNDIGFPSLTINLYQTKDLQFFTEPKRSVIELHSNKEVLYLINGEPSSTISFQLNPGKDAYKVDFPENFKSFGEFITVADIPALYLDQKPEWNNTALVVVKPKEGWIFIYPQDWFNKDKGIDFGYQWITRAVRKPGSNNILVRGIRIDEVELDDSNRQVKL